MCQAMAMAEADVALMPPQNLLLIGAEKDELASSFHSVILFIALQFQQAQTDFQGQIYFFHGLII